MVKTNFVFIHKLNMMNILSAGNFGTPIFYSKKLRFTWTVLFFIVGIAAIFHVYTFLYSLYHPLSSLYLSYPSTARSSLVSEQCSVTMFLLIGIGLTCVYRA